MNVTNIHVDCRFDLPMVKNDRVWFQAVQVLWVYSLTLDCCASTSVYADQHNGVVDQHHRLVHQCNHWAD